MEDKTLNNKNLRRFGITMGIAVIVFALFLFAAKKCSIMPLIVISAVFFTSAVVKPLILKPVYTGWMKLALILSWINTTLILLVIYYSVFTLVGILIKLFGVDLLDTKMEKTKSSYWQKKEEEELNNLDYERQF